MCESLSRDLGNRLFRTRYVTQIFFFFFFLRNHKIVMPFLYAYEIEIHFGNGGNMSVGSMLFPPTHFSRERKKWTEIKNERGRDRGRVKCCR